MYGDKIYIWGGRNDRATCSILFCFDTVWHCWTAPKTTGNIPLARDGHTACMWKNCMFIFGGYEEESDAFARSVYCLNLDKMTWSIVHTSGERHGLFLLEYILLSVWFKKLFRIATFSTVYALYFVRLTFFAYFH